MLPLECSYNKTKVVLNSLKENEEDIKKKNPMTGKMD